MDYDELLDPRDLIDAIRALDTKELRALLYALAGARGQATTMELGRVLNSFGAFVASVRDHDAAVIRDRDIELTPRAEIIPDDDEG